MPPPGPSGVPPGMPGQPPGGPPKPWPEGEFLFSWWHVPPPVISRSYAGSQRWAAFLSPEVSLEFSVGFSWGLQRTCPVGGGCPVVSLVSRGGRQGMCLLWDSRRMAGFNCDSRQACSRQDASELRGGGCPAWFPFL